mgnify:FL=1|jgi:hypothetical protein
MINIRQDLIQKELYWTYRDELTYRKLKPSNRFINKLFNHYYVVEHTEHFYDSEPEYDDEEFNMYMDYDYIHHRINPASGTALFNTILNSEEIAKEQGNFRFSEEEYTMEELKQAYDKITQQRKDYESRRIEFNNWIEVYSDGIWGMSQKDVDKISREHLKSIKRCGVSYNGRLYIAEKEDSIFIYYYGRDFALVDYWWIFKRKERDR